MFGDINRVSLMGNVTKDPELRFTPSGAGVISFSMATNRRIKKNDQWTDEVAFHNIVCWNSAEQLAKRVKKGTRIYIDGRSQTRSWDGQDGKKQYKHEIIAEKVILISRFEGSNDEGTGSAEPTGNESSEDNSIDPNDLPF